MVKQNKQFKVLGIMSGTSLDGVDLCLCKFELHGNAWNFQLLEAETIPYSKTWIEKLKNIENDRADRLIQLHFEYGHYLGNLAQQFIGRTDHKVDLISSHGHTIFHQVEKGFTFQLGHGASIAASSNFPVASDFRSMDVALKGQGAPLVPFGDRLLFSEYDCCINLGGICNLSYEENGLRKAYDICPFNMVLNHLMQKEFNLPFDEDGRKSAEGAFNKTLFDHLNQFEYYQLNPPKSLGKEWVFKKVIPLLEKSELPIKDLLHTFSLHIVHQLNLAVKKINKNPSILITGGGVKNKFIIQKLQKENENIKIPELNLIDFKEAIIFSFLGLKRFLRQINTISSATGSTKDSCGGTIFYP